MVTDSIVVMVYGGSGGDDSPSWMLCSGDDVDVGGGSI